MKMQILILFILTVIATAETAGAQVITIEAEWYDDSHNIGGTPIGILPDPGCSGGLLLIGLDLSDEWTSYDVSVDPAGVYAPRLICRGNVDTEYHMLLNLVPDTLGGSQAIDFFYTGTGYG